MSKSPASPEIPTRGHAHGAVEKGERSEQGLCGKIGQKSVNRKLLHIAQGLCREFGVWKRLYTPLQRRSLSALQAVGLVAFRRPHAPCRGGACPSRRNACGKNRVALKWGRFQICHCEGALRPWQSREGTADSHRLSIKAYQPIASVAAFPAQPLAALPPYGCGVPLAGSERLVGDNSTVRGHWCTTAPP